MTLVVLPDRAPRRDLPCFASAETVPSRASSGSIGVSAGPVFGETPGASLGFGPAFASSSNIGRSALGGTETLSRSAPFASGTVRVGLTSGDLQLCRMLNLAGKSFRAGACARRPRGARTGGKGTVSR